MAPLEDDRTSTGADWTERYQLRSGVATVLLDDGQTRLLGHWHAETVGALSPDDEAMLAALAREPYAADELAGSVELLDRLRSGGWAVVTVASCGRPLYRMSPVEAPANVSMPADAPLRLSRFAIIRAGDDGGLVIESPMAWCDVHILDLSILAVLTGGAHNLPEESVAAIRRDLAWCGLLVGDQTESAFRVQQWKPHELWFHERSAIGPRSWPGRFGNTDWARDCHAPVAARPAVYPGRTVALPAADPLPNETSLGHVLTQRRSVRTHDNEQPISLEQLGAFLQHSARTSMFRRADGVERRTQPFPSAGASYELEIYPLVRLAAGMDAGLYHYDSSDHVLREVRTIRHHTVRQILRHTETTASEPQVLLLISARVGRVMWGYEQLSYSLILKDVGVLFQTMYLVATALGLAPCALGASDAHAFSQATGQDGLSECNVGAFLLGSRPGGEQG
jgi:SagB-type dehydrogenase family enzyme